MNGSPLGELFYNVLFYTALIIYNVFLAKYVDAVNRRK